MKKDSSLPFIIGVSGISGAGKSTLIKKLAEIFDATTLFWDDFDEISVGPEDYVDWYHSSRNYEDWVYTDLAETLDRLKSGQQVLCPATHKTLLPTKYILFDAPLGYSHQATGQYIDFLICLDTPPDVALARRLLRDHKNTTDAKKILKQIDDYLLNCRPLFILSPEEKVCDLHLDGSLHLEVQCQKVLMALKNSERSNHEKIEIEMTSLTNDIKQKIYEGFSRHALEKTGFDEKFDPIAFIAKGKDQSFMGAIVSELFWGALHIKYVFVEESYRRKGIATQLIDHVLTFAKNHQCPFAFVETMNFQALDFYEKLGFTLEYTREGYKHKTSFHYLRKDL